MGPQLQTQPNTAGEERNAQNTSYRFSERVELELENIDRANDIRSRNARTSGIGHRDNCQVYSLYHEVATRQLYNTCIQCIFKAMRDIGGENAGDLLVHTGRPPISRMALNIQCMWNRRPRDINLACQQRQWRPSLWRPVLWIGAFNAGMPPLFYVRRWQ